jgi:hypothetical protein
MAAGHASVTPHLELDLHFRFPRRLAGNIQLSKIWRA